MAFAKFNAETAAKESTGGNYINQSGIYDVTLKNLIIDFNDKGHRSFNLYLTYNGQDQVIYNAFGLELADGTENKSGWALLNDLMGIAQVDELSDPETETLPIGKQGADKDVGIMPEITDLDMKIWIKQGYYLSKDGEIKEQKSLMRVYFPDGTSVAEAINETESGKRLEKDSKHFDSIKLGKGLTQEMVDAWIAGGRKSEKVATAAPKASFGARPKFGAK